MADRVWFLDVGQGHAALAISGSRALLIDCPAGRDGVVRQQLLDNDAELDHIFITHRDLDHCGGIPALLKDPGALHVHMNFGWAVPPQSTAKIKVKAVLSSILSIVERDGLDFSNEYEGDAGSLGSISWRLLAPNAVVVGRAALDDNTNRSSMVIMLESAGTRVLVTGDADDAAIKHLVEAGADLAVDVLLIPHHGAQLKRLGELLHLTQPSVAVVSAGRVNPFGHPHPSTLLALAETEGTRLACTEVSASCHASELGEAACAGSTCVQFGGEPVVLGTEVHEARLVDLEWPICVKKTLKP